MKKLLAFLIVVFSLCVPAQAIFTKFQLGYTLQTNANLRQENFFGLTGTDWTNFTGNYTPGLGNPAVATDDYYHQNGISGFRPYDLLDPTLTGVCASAGASIAASRGRYAWPLAPDHGSGNASVWNGSYNFRMGYSNDPGVLPARLSTIYFGENPTALPTISTITASISNGSGGAGNILAVTAYTGIISNAGQAAVSGSGVTTATISSQSSGTAGQTGNYVIGGAAQFVASQTMTVTQTNYQIYYDVQLVCNPDDATTPFWLYAEGQASSVQHEMGVIKSADLLTWTTALPTHNALNFNTWSSFQRINRIGTGNWVSKGYQNNYPQNGNVSARSTWTSTDGNVWAPGTTNLNWCLPASSQVGTTTDCTGASRKVEPLQSPDTITVGGSSWIMGKISTYSGSTRVGDQWVGRAAVNASQSVIDTPSAVNVSPPYGGVYPGPTYLQAVTGYVEDGVAYYYAAKGWPISNALWGVVSFATYANGGGLWQQNLDLFTEITDATAAAGAAPAGVRASCAASTATINWYSGVLPTDTMRLYRGPTAGSQTTLVGDFTGSSATDTGMTLNAVTYYKLVYLNGGIEQKNRVVSTYCSTSSAFVNAHMTRALADGADSTTCNRTMMDTFDNWLVSNGLSNNLLFATMADFCVAKSGSVISKVYDMGTTRLPRGGDYTPTTSNTTYNATGIGGKPAWVNANSTDYGYYGGGSSYLNNIRRKTQITLFSLYQKPSTGAYQPFVTGQGTIRMLLQHSSGSPGGINCLLSDATQQKTATATMASATAVNSAACTFDGTTWLAYGNATAGSGQTGLVIPSPDLNPPDILTGQIGIANNVQVLMSGSDTGFWNRVSGTYTPNGNAAQSSVRAQMVFDKALTGAQITSLDALVR